MNEQIILNEVFEKIRQYIESNADNQKPVVNYKSPAELADLIKMQIGDSGADQNEFLEMVDQYLTYSVRTGNKQFLNQLYSGFNFPAFIGDVLTTLTNTSMYTYEVAPVATEIEKTMISLMNSFAGYENGEGLFVSGGSNANLVAMFSARNRLLPETRFTGYDRDQKLTAFINEQAHYSIETAANVLGIGSKNVIKVKADADGRIIPEEFENAIAESIARGEKPFFAVATAATTLLGSYDPINEMAEICQRNGIWLHADGSFGGSIILSEKHRNMMNGIEKTDSFAWNPHKLMNIPLICSVILLKQKDTLKHNLTDLNTDYIFHEIDVAEDLGKKSIQCGRRVDAVKLWFAWKYFGLKGYQQRIDNLMDMAAWAEKLVLENPRLELMAARQSFAICFRYIPEREADLNEFNLQLRESLRKTGQTIVNYGYIGKDLTIRLITANAGLEKSDIELFFNYLTATAKQMEENLHIA
jgi:glutamate/tyrosine decarboxylase-like PLP-dependent enzyme